jgi:membrane-bound metal-dependent hydrolase YbcI (DUF457 family)
MKIPEHLALSYLLAQLGPQQTFGTAGTVLVIAAGMLPDLDGVSILGGWACHLKYHRKVGHGLPMTLMGPLLLAVVWAPHLEDGQSWLVLWTWLQLSLLLHLFVDVLFYRWRVQLFWPYSNWGLGVGLVSWNDLVPTLVLYAASAVALVWPAKAPLAAVAGLGLVGLYLAWRAWWREQLSGWLAWITGGWARNSPRLCRWLTGDFVT